MQIKEGTIIKPLPSEEDISEEERAWRVNLPTAYKEFIKRYGGGIPIERAFLCKEDNHEYAIDRFLCICPDYETNKLGMYDIGVTWTQIEDRLSDNPDLIGVDMLPIAVLFAGDFLCLDFKNTKVKPSVCVWSHEESDEDSPVTYYVADSFEEFCKLLTE